MSLTLPSVCDDVLLDESSIQMRVSELGRQISEDFEGRDLRLVTVLKGGLFFLADLCRAVDVPLALDFLAVAPYAPGRGGVVRVTKDLTDDISAAHVVLVEDVVDTGLTINYVLSLLKGHGPASLTVCALLDKPSRRIAEVPIHYRGFTMPDRFLVGYGLDLFGCYRNLPFVATLRDDAVLYVIRRLAWAIGLLVGVVVIGTVGYLIIEHWTVLDAVYMTVITVGTVGFTEVHPMGATGRVFTIFLIFAGIGALGFAFGQLVEFLVEGYLTDILEVRRMQKRLATLENHTIVAGLGRVGSVVARALADEQAAFVVIDTDIDAVDAAREAGWILVQGDATEEQVLRAAGVERASSLVTALSGDADNLFVTITARSLNPHIFIVARSSHGSTEPKLVTAGANRVITPNVIGGRRMASMVLHPTVSDYLDLVTGVQGVEFRLQEVELADGSSYVGKSLAVAGIRDTTGAQVVAIVNSDGTVDANPPAATVLTSGQRLVVVGSVDQVAVLAERACRL